MRNRTKLKHITAIGAELSALDSGYKHTFVCPLCLRGFPFDSPDISIAHIVPKAANGRTYTYACRQCNSTCGHNQDKWFGERSRLHSIPGTNIFDARPAPSRFQIGDYTLNGKINVSPNGPIDVLLYTNRNDPKVMADVTRLLQTHPVDTNLSVSFPLLREERMVRLGYLTAAYLLWFRNAGYSWVLQSHLSEIREQILRPSTETYAPMSFVVKGAHWIPWIGIVSNDRMASPAAGIDDHLILFPSFDQPTFRMALNDKEQANVVPNLMIPSAFPYQGPPVAIMFEDRLLVAPDTLRRGTFHGFFLRFVRGQPAPQILYPITEDEYRRHTSQRGAVTHRVDLSATPSPAD